MGLIILDKWLVNELVFLLVQIESGPYYHAWSEAQVVNDYSWMGWEAFHGIATIGLSLRCPTRLILDIVWL